MTRRGEFATRCAAGVALAGLAALAAIFSGGPRGGRLGEPPVQAPGTLRLGPEVPADAWLEAEISRADAGAWRLFLERASDDAALFLEWMPAEGAALVELARGSRRVLWASPVRDTGPPGEVRHTRTVWARRRSGRWTIWLDGSLALGQAAAESMPGSRTGFAAESDGPELARLSVRAPGDPRFADDFMRERPEGVWSALKGSWELAGIRMPELSANPFSLRARWPDLERPDGFAEMRAKPPKSGLGVNLSSWRGVVQIERITGNGPAALAGLREDDIVLAIDDQVFRSVRPFSFHEDLEGPEGSEVRLTVLRPGELRPRKVTLRRQVYRWAQIDYGEPLAGTAGPGEEPEALAAAGEPSWDGYRFEASVSCAGSTGGGGLAFAVRDAERYHLFAMTGRSEAEDPPREGTLSLIRVRGLERRVLAERSWRPRPGTWYRMAVELDGERIAAFVDGARVLEAEDGDLPAGRIGLWALRGEGTRFDDVAVSSERAWTAPAPDDRAPSALADELDMRRWANPSDEWQADPASGWWLQTYRFPGEISLTVPADEAIGRLEAALGCGDSGASDGTVFELDLRGRSSSLRHDPRARCALRPDAPVELVLSRDGRARVVQAGRTLLEAGGSMRRGDRVALRGPALPASLGAIRVRSDGVREYHFRRSPVDWAVEAGHWGMMNKWICDPRFSWLGGQSRSLAAIWHKRPVRGDVTLDFFAALVMISDDPPYERVGDFACTILGDGTSLASGYTFIVSGGRNRWTRLYGGGRLLAESRRPLDLLPSNVWGAQHRRALHQKWFRITLERRASRVRAMLDGREVFSVPDSLGLESGYVALWTQDNGMLVGRVRIAEDSPGQPNGRPGAARSATDPGAEPPAWGAPAQPAEVGGLTNLALGEIASRISPDGSGPSGGTAVLVENVRGGGPFAVASVRPCDVRSLVSFDFRAESGVRVDLYLEPDSLEFGRAGPFRVRLTGPECENERHPVLGGPFARSDGLWHSVRLDLGRLFEAYRASRAGAGPPEPSTVTPVFACLEEGERDEYLPAGIGGNARGARYWVSGFRIDDPVRLDRSPPQVREVLLPGEKGTPEGRVRVIFDDDVSGVERGSIALRLRGAEDREPPPAGRTGSGKLPPSVVSEFEPAPAPPGGRTGRVLHGGDRWMTFDPVRQELEVELAAAGLRPPLGAIDVIAFADRAGRRGESFSRSALLHSDSTGPVLEELEFLPELPGELRLDFEPGARTRLELQDRVGPGSPVFSLDRSVSAGGDSSCRLTVANLASPFVLRLFEGMTELSRLRALSFDCRVPDQTPVNLIVRGRKGFHGLLFTDRDDPRSEWSHGIRYVGEVEGARSDGLWHRVSVDLAEVFRAAYPEMSAYPAQGIYLADWGWNGLWPGDGYWLDNVSIEGVRRGSGLRVRWRAFDVSGVEAASWVLDRDPDTIPPERPREIASMDPASATVSLDEAERLPDGEAFFHVRFADRAGNWSVTHHRRVFVDNTPPRVARVEPADGTASSARELRVYLDDYSGIEPSSLRLRVAGREYRVDRRACTFDAARRVLAWSARGALREDMLAPGERIEAELVSARDIVGNEMELPVRWSWYYDPSLDREPPPAPRLRFTTGRPYEGYIDGPTFGDTNDFERELGALDAIAGCTVELSSEAAAHGRGGARVRVASERAGEFAVRLRERYWFVDERPFFSFHMRVCEGPPPERLALRLDLFREKRELELPSPHASEWRRYALDLGEQVRSWGVRFPEFQGEPYKLAGPIYLVGRARPGTIIDIDDTELAQATWHGAVVEWEVPRDTSGIDGFAVAWDRSPDTIPPEQVTHPVAAFAAGSKYRWTLPGAERYGKWFVHVRARDGSGNWGETAHLAIDLLGEGRTGADE